MTENGTDESLAWIKIDRGAGYQIGKGTVTPSQSTLLRNTDASCAMPHPTVGLAVHFEKPENERNCSW
jgi:hypothetical protein